MQDKETWVSVELWDNSIEDCLRRWFQNKWGLPKEAKNNIIDIFFYGTTEKYQGTLEIFTFTDGYIFLNTKSLDLLPHISKIHGAMDWVRNKSIKGTNSLITFDQVQVTEMKKQVEGKINQITDVISEGSMVKLCKGLYTGMEGMVESKEGIMIEVSFYLNSKNFTTVIPFWFIEKKE